MVIYSKAENTISVFGVLCYFDITLSLALKQAVPFIYVFFYFTLFQSLPSPTSDKELAVDKLQSHSPRKVRLCVVDISC